MDIEAQDPVGVKDTPSPASDGVVVPMTAPRRFRPAGVAIGSAGQAAAASKPAPAGKREKPSLPFLFSEGVVAGGLNGAQLAVRSTGPDSPCLMYVWAGSHWERMGDNEGAAAADAWLRKRAPDKVSPNKAKECWESTKLRLLTSHRFPEPSAREVRIPLRTHTLCVQADGTLLAVPPSPDFGLEHCLAIDADELPSSGGVYCIKPLGHAGQTAFSKWLDETLPVPGERQLVQELCGQTLMPQAFSVAGWLVGDAGSGKSTVLEMLSMVHSNAVRMFLNKLDGEFALQPMLDASVCLVDEVKPKALEEETLKTLISQNKVSIPRKHIASVGEFRPRAKWMICSNQMPVVHDLSEGLWRRLVFVHFRNVVPEAQRKSDVHLDFDLREVLDWMLEGVVRISQRGRMLTHAELPATSRAMKDGAKLASDSVLVWMQGEGVKFDSSLKPNWVPCQSIYDRYVAFCAGVAEPINANAFWRTMRERLRASGVDLPTPSNRRVSGKLVRCQPFLFGASPSAFAGTAPAAPPVAALAPCVLPDEWFDAARRADASRLTALLLRGAVTDARTEGLSALGFVLESQESDDSVQAAAAVLLRAGAKAQSAGQLTDRAQSRLLKALAAVGAENTEADRSLARLGDTIFGKSSENFVSYPLPNQGAHS